MGFKLVALRAERYNDRDYVQGEAFEVETEAERDKLLAAFRQSGGEIEPIFGDPDAAPASGSAEAAEASSGDEPEGGKKASKRAKKSAEDAPE